MYEKKKGVFSMSPFKNHSQNRCFSSQRHLLSWSFLSRKCKENLDKSARFPSPLNCFRVASFESSRLGHGDFKPLCLPDLSLSIRQCLNHRTNLPEADNWFSSKPLRYQLAPLLHFFFSNSVLWQKMLSRKQLTAVLWGRAGFCKLFYP